MTNARDRIEPLARLVGSMLELQELCFQGSQLGAESHETGACNLGQSLVKVKNPRARVLALVLREGTQFDRAQCSARAA
jgi:hypothetical protein